MKAKWLTVLCNVAHGMSINECAQSMGVSRNMVNRHLERARNKLNAKTTTEAVYIAAKSGLIVLLISVNLLSNGDNLRRAPRRPRKQKAVAAIII